jgi:hypothetical protein
MVDCLIFLFTKRATIWVGEAPAGKPVRRPASVVSNKAQEKFAFSRRLGSPDQIVGLEVDRSIEEGFIR